MPKKHGDAFNDRRIKFDRAVSKFRSEMNSRFEKIYSPRPVVGDVFFYGDRIQGVADLLAEYFYLFYRLASANPKFIKTKPAPWARNKIQPLIECQKRKMANWIWASPKNSQTEPASESISEPALGPDSDCREGVAYFLNILENSLAKMKADFEVEQVIQQAPVRRFKKRPPNSREEKILGVIRSGLHGSKYCARLDFQEVKGLAQWYAKGWPREGYASAYMDTDRTRRAMFRKWILDERTRIAIRWPQLAKTEKR